MQRKGLQKKLDPMGRMTIPKDFRTMLEIEVTDSLEMFLDNDKIILRKFETNCCICNNSVGVKNYKSRSICLSCHRELKELSDGVEL